ncbi:hypothetical protein TNCV_1876481 [Trichonephila clavipes]|nr:hypothetical protein TNCV_1876481 [Trichonephila clavipes]
MYGPYDDIENALRTHAFFPVPSETDTSVLMYHVDSESSEKDDKVPLLYSLSLSAPLSCSVKESAIMSTV